ncbi:hypothetical protein BDP27DRAFT_422053 [Rhodocollybia butyracea]|uniref:Uncharacterized protein n=1 Tax=Rhodocollybia butyracea TaxID=206335 RepID=A0A9P5PE22_9AGAR|nr:hypothetical protein BDP27DRAFT_422053 [Rhodocollybia butyracea]
MVSEIPVLGSGPSGSAFQSTSALRIHCHRRSAILWLKIFLALIHLDHAATSSTIATLGGSSESLGSLLYICCIYAQAVGCVVFSAIFCRFLPFLTLLIEIPLNPSLRSDVKDRSLGSRSSFLRASEP